ncbi:hypothetical protein KXD93_16355 [Mucilaginibacter sp. BJC16-A38]|uniref:hypothetical protein n=1 Tax=Mucilaginibacter phenanthrenivorans TaxID=1234842 RepID=UPI00215767C6|nr:hypothetical protein [Mucilaginibacter phenanthrenivorans]MCR8559231.1 hypothetical protein [Mucilaginibacter phenanthrenivorans]
MMLKILKAIFNAGPPNQPISADVKNRLRFDSIHSDKQPNSLKDIYGRLIGNDESLSDEEIIERYQKFSNGIQTNSFSAAELELVSISTLCYFRPQLTSLLIRASLLSIIYSIGDNITFEDVIAFLQQRVLAETVEPYGGRPHDQGLTWLLDILPASKNEITPILIDVIKINKEELDAI